MKFQLRDRVRKPKGYNYEPAIIVAAFTNTKGEERYVAEITEGQCAGMLHVFNADQLEHVDESQAWIEEHVYLDSDTKERRQIFFDNDRNRLFFFAEQLDFDKDDTRKPARYWLDEIEGWKQEWFDVIKARYTI